MIPFMDSARCGAPHGPCPADIGNWVQQVTNHPRRQATRRILDVSSHRTTRGLWARAAPAVAPATIAAAVETRARPTRRAKFDFLIVAIFGAEAGTCL